MTRSHLLPAVGVLLALTVAAAIAQPIDARLEQLRTEANVSFGTAPTDDLAALPAGTFGLISWNVQVGGTSPSASALRPPQVEKMLGALFAGTYQLLAAQEVSSMKHS